MFLTVLMFVVAIALSAIAAFYSIVGLTAIFAAAVMPIVIMGTVLEVAKLTVTVWLHEHWHECKLVMKLYLVPAVFTLMVITSMGIFGFLSKAHLDQVVPTGDVQAQVALIDERINNERDTIANARTLLAQLDRAVTDISNTPDREINGRIVSSAERALQVRRQQARDRTNLTQTIEQAQARIVQLQEQKAPFARDLRKIEAEVGPIKYIAALIYGDDPDQNLLERAVRWVIIILVAVFDPLAIMMLLAATESRSWYLQRQQRQEEKNADFDDVVSAMVPAGGVIDQDLDPTISRTEASRVDAPAIDPDSVHPRDDVEITPVSQVDPIDIQDSPAAHDDEDDPNDSDIIRQCKRLWKLDHPEQTLKEQRRLVAMGHLDHEPWLDYMDDPRVHAVITHGDNLPTQAHRGDIFVLTSVTPTVLYKYNGDAWIQVSKENTDQYAHDDHYVDYLISRISSGSYDPDLLTDAERAQIAQRLRQEV
jgi:hypothetical protein